MNGRLMKMELDGSINNIESIEEISRKIISQPNIKKNFL